MEQLKIYANPRWKNSITRTTMQFFLKWEQKQVQYKNIKRKKEINQIIVQNENYEKFREEGRNAFNL